MGKIVRNEPEPQSLILELEEMLKQRDEEICNLKEEVQALQSEVERFSKENQSLNSAYQQISDQMAFFKAQVSAQSFMAQAPQPVPVSIPMPQHYSQPMPDQYRQPSYHQPINQDDQRSMSYNFRAPHYPHQHYDGAYHY